jgi:hypothetical protein
LDLARKLYRTLRQQWSCYIVKTSIGFSHEVKISSLYDGNKMITDIQITKAKDYTLVNSFWLQNSQRACFITFSTGGNHGIWPGPYSAQ